MSETPSLADAHDPERGARIVRVTSPKNSIVKEVRDAAAGRMPGLMVAEGRQLVREALDAELPMPLAAVAPKLLQARDGHELRRRLEQRCDTFVDCLDSVFERMSSLTTPPGVLAVLRRPNRELAELLAPDETDPLLVVAAGLRDPGNLGGVVRTAEAAGASGLCVLRGSADPFREKAVRGSSGSCLRLPIAVGDDDAPVGIETAEFLSFAAERGLRLVVLDSGDGRDDPAHARGLDVDLTGPVALVLGGEAHGVDPEILAAAGDRLAIPMRAPVDSLNVAVAAGIVLYEARRQRTA